MRKESGPFGDTQTARCLLGLTHSRKLLLYRVIENPPTFAQVVTVVTTLIAVATAVLGYLAFFRKAKPPPPAPHVSVPPTDKPRILIVDDEKALLRALEVALNGDYNVKLFSDPHDALDRIIQWHREPQQPIALAIIDYWMPEIDGMKFVTIMKQLYPGTPLVFFSGASVMFNYAQRHMVAEVWQKPIGALELKEKIVDILRPE